MKPILQGHHQRKFFNFNSYHKVSCHPLQQMTFISTQCSQHYQKWLSNQLKRHIETAHYMVL